MVDEQIIQQVSKYTYLGVNITYDRNTILEVRTQASKAAMLSGYLQNVI